MGILYATPWLQVAVWMCVAVMAIATYFVSVVALRGKGGGRGEAERAWGELHQAIERFRHKYAALDAYSNAYFNTFHAAGWDELKLLLDDLELAESSLLLLMERHRYEEARDVSLFLLGRASPDLAQKLMTRFEGLENLADWQQRARDILLRVIQASMESARKIASLGINRGRSHKPTLVTLAELRSSLSE